MPARSRALEIGRLVVAVSGLALLLLGAAAPPTAVRERARTQALSRSDLAFLDTLERRTFLWFWERSDSVTGLTPDRWPTRSFVSVGAMGFALTAYPIGAQRGWVSRARAAERVRATLRFLWRAPQDSSASGAIGIHGFFYHFLVPETGLRFEKIELSTIDSALLFAGALFCQSYFDRADATESAVRALAESLYARADWTWAQPRPPSICLGWNPESGFLPYDWRGYDEAMILPILALGSPRHAVGDSAWAAWTSGYRWGSYHGRAHVGFAPLFGHQYSHVWVDFRGIRDAYMRAHGIDYFENSRRATLAQRDYAIDNPGGFRGYGPGLWGLTACDGPMDGEITIAGRKRAFHTYSGRGATFWRVNDDGTVAPCAAGGSIPFAPKQTVSVLRAMKARYGKWAYSRYGFLDCFNPTLKVNAPITAGRIVPGVGWFDTDYLGIDQGPIVAMIENYRSGLVWRTLRTNRHVVRGLRRAGFTGGWLDTSRVAR